MFRQDSVFGAGGSGESSANVCFSLFVHVIEVVSNKLEVHIHTHTHTHTHTGKEALNIDSQAVLVSSTLR